LLSLVLDVLGAGLSIWDSKEKTKYQDKFIRIKTDIYEEMKKPYEDRNHAALDDLYFQLELLCNSFTSVAGSKNALPK
jgi:hypothetical protein